MFTYKELKEDLQGCLDGLKADRCQEATQEEMDELKGYMLRFIEDVESDLEIIEYEKLKDCPLEELPLHFSSTKSEKVREMIGRRLQGDESTED